MPMDRSKYPPEWDAIAADVIQRPDLCAVACMKRIQDFMRDEIKRAKERDDWPDTIRGKISLANDVDELVCDLLRTGTIWRSNTA